MCSSDLAALDRAPQPDPDFDRAQPDAGASWAPYRVFNIGHSEPVALLDFVDTLEAELGVKAVRDMRPMQPGDVAATFADTSRLAAHTGVHPGTPLADGIARFAAWYRRYHRP